MTALVLADNAYGTLASGLTATDVTINFTAGHGARFPAVPSGGALHCCILNSNNVLEEVIVTLHVAGADSATITRAAGSTSAKAWNAGDRIEARTSSTALGYLRNVVVQEVGVTTSGVATGATPIPLDDTIPQITEGDQYMSLSITPTNASNYLVIEVVANVSPNVGTDVTAALFQDSTANALAAIDEYMNFATGLICMNFRHRMLAGTTSLTTFTVRLGPSSGLTITFNGVSNARKFGGVMSSSIVIREVTP